ncbi:MAG: hypothetical protein R3C11_29345 [Planctomycetaceae bacterium]
MSRYPGTYSQRTDRHPVRFGRGEQVAISGNFLIDSQMQLEGKPSLIDVSRAVALKEDEQKEGPLDLSAVELVKYEGETGEKLESLYAAYLPVQQVLTEDKSIPESLAAPLHQAASVLAPGFNSYGAA